MLTKLREKLTTFSFLPPPCFQSPFLPFPFSYFLTFILLGNLN